MKRPPALCGARTEDHVSRRCLGCKRIYNKRYRARQPRQPRTPVQQYRVSDPATCAFCGLARGNSLKVAVYYYPLHRTIYRGDRKSTASFGRLGICDRCVIAKAEPSTGYMRRMGLTTRAWGKVA